MGRELTKRHSSLFKRKVVNPFIFAHDVYMYGKSRELVSFIVWELFHKLKLYRKRKYLSFNNSDGLTLGNEQLTGGEFRKKIYDDFGRRDLTIVACEYNWKNIFMICNGQILGTLYPNDTDLYKSNDGGQSITMIARFPDKIKSIFVSSDHTMFVCTTGAVYTSIDHGESFKRSLVLGSRESFFRFNNGATETPDKRIIIGEYGNVWENKGWKRLAYLYCTSDNGETWEKSNFLIKQGTNKHVHVVKYSNLLNRLFVADGDNKKKLWVSDSSGCFDLKQVKWRPANKYHIQMGGYTSVVETDEKVVFGTDYQGGTNFIVETTDGRTFTKKVVPDPYRRSPIDNMTQRKSRQGNEIWANLPYCAANTRCLLMYTSDGANSWNRVIEYNSEAHRVWLISSSNEMREELYFSIQDLRNKDRVVYKILDGD